MSRLRPLLIGLGVPAVALVIFYLTHLTSDSWSFSALTEDPLHTTGGSPLLGSGTNLMLLGWGLTIGACVAAWAATRDRFFVVIGLLTVGLWADDAFMVHEWWLYHWGLNEKLMFLVWGSAAWLVALTYRRRFRQQRPDVLLVAVGFLAGSVFFDRPVIHDLGWLAASGDEACKLLGIYAWLTWVVLAGLSAVRPAVDVDADLAASNPGR